MADTDKPLSELYHEKVEALKAGGLSNADAIRQVAQELGKQERTVRAGIHQFKSKATGGAKTAAKRVTRQVRVSTEDAIANARGILEAALTGIDGDIAAAKADLDAAQVRYDDLVTKAKARREDLQRRIKALS